MESQTQWCENRACADFGKIGAQNIKVYSHLERRVYCVTGGQTFVFEKGTFFAALHTTRPVLLDVVAMLVKRKSLRAISRVKHCAPNTILHCLDLAGQHAAAVSRHCIKGLHLTQAQIDELWTFVNKTGASPLRRPRGYRGCLGLEGHPFAQPFAGGYSPFS